MNCLIEFLAAFANELIDALPQLLILAADGGDGLLVIVGLPH